MLQVDADDFAMNIREMVTQLKGLLYVVGIEK
jgi:hypothetical protein